MINTLLKPKHFALFAVLLLVSKSNAQVSSTKYGALAVDKSNGFYYGWSVDHKTMLEAEKRAIDECAKKGGSCKIVLTWSGTGCAVYRTVANQKTAYGWGVAKTKEEADVIATRELMKRSNGQSGSNFVWGCNSNNSGVFKIIKNDAGPAAPPLIEGFNDNATKTSGLKKNGKVIVSSTRYRFHKELKKGEIFSFALSGDGYFENVNLYIIVDKNGKQMTFGGERFFEQIEQFLPYNINKNEGTKFEWGIVTVKDLLRTDKRFGADFHADDEKELEKAMSEWGPEGKAKYPQNFTNVYRDQIVFTDKDFNVLNIRTGWFSMEQNRSAGTRLTAKSKFNNQPLN